MITPNLEAFKKDLEQLINRHSLEGQCANTPDFVLANYLCDCLIFWTINVDAKYRWQGRDTNGNPLNK